MTKEDTAPCIDLSVAQQLATIRICNPAHHNAMTLDMWQALPARMQEADRNPDVRAIILRGSGDTAFVSGADISEFSDLRARGAPARAYDKANSIAFAAIRNCSKPTIAMIQGACMGGGFGIAAACDLRYAATNATFALPAAKLGIGYPVDAMQDIVSAVGNSAAKELFYTAKTINAEEAQRLGFLNQVFDEDELEPNTRSVAERIANGAPLTLVAAKKAILASQDPSEQKLKEAVQAAEACFDSADYEEGVNAFLNKHKAHFVGE
ncbi:enoyl-CoA hydratase [Pararhizobium sp. IMCC21322]|uniref:enoyl-CoA hydratase n=1 Tax=Pararhizobium sp. IMCC21322 TaxID=3067903 RepID=UPI00274238D3|nr:enoyl-CoA hydratase [Pararhizobium sp. IMCC21322]